MEREETFARKEDGDDDDEDDSYYTYGSPAQLRPWDRRDWWPKVTKPEKAGLELLFGGEFGRIQHQIKSRSGNHNIARKIVSRRLGPRPTRKEDIASVSHSMPSNL